MTALVPATMKNGKLQYKFINESIAEINFLFRYLLPSIRYTYMKNFPDRY